MFHDTQIKIMSINLNKEAEKLKKIQFPTVFAI